MQANTEPKNGKGGTVQAPRPIITEPHKNKNVLIDADLCNAALNMRRTAEAIEPGFNPEAWLQERGL